MTASKKGTYNFFQIQSTVVYILQLGGDWRRYYSLPTSKKKHEKREVDQSKGQGQKDEIRSKM